MEPSDVLLTFAEIAVAFAGFSSVVAIFQRRSSRGSPNLDLFRFWVMLEHSLAALFFCLLPFPLYFVGLAEATVWSSCGMALALFCVGHTVVTVLLARRGNVAVISSRTSWMNALAGAVYTAIVLSQLLNLLALGRLFGPYLLGIFLVLFASGVNFVRLVWIGSAPREG